MLAGACNRKYEKLKKGRRRRNSKPEREREETKSGRYKRNAHVKLGLEERMLTRSSKTGRLREIGK